MASSVIAHEEQGEALGCDWALGHDEREKTKNLAIHAARQALEKGTVFEVRSRWLSKKPTSGDYGQVAISVREQEKNWGVAWYRVPEGPRATAIEPLFEHDIDDGERNEFGGYVLVARIKA